MLTHQASRSRRVLLQPEVYFSEMITISWLSAEFGFDILFAWTTH